MILESIGNDRRGSTDLHLIMLRIVRVMRNVQDKEAFKASTCKDFLADIHNISYSCSR